MPTNNPFTSTEQLNAQREYMTETAKNYQNEADVWAMFQEWKDTPINAQGTKVPLEVSPNPSLGVPDLDGGATPTIGSRNLDYLTITYAPLMQGRGETYEALLNNNKETAEDEVMRNTKSDLKQQIKFINDYVSRGDGSTGLAYTSEAYQVGTNTVIACNGASDSIGPSQLVVGGWYQFWDPADLTATGLRDAAAANNPGPFQLVSKDAADATFSAAIPDDVQSGDLIVPEGSAGDAATALCGLPYIIDSGGTYFGKTRSTSAYVQAYENALGGALTAAELAETYFGCQQRGGYGFGGGAELASMLKILVNVTQKQNYYNLALNSGAVVGSPLTYNVNGTSRPAMDLGMRSFEFTWFGAPMKLCNSTRGDEIYFVNESCLKKAVLKDLGDVSLGITQTAHIMLVNSSGVPILTRASYHDFIGQAFSPEPHRLGKLSGITITNLVTQKATMVYG